MIERGPAITYIDGHEESAPTIYVSPQVTDLLAYTPEVWIGRGPERRSQRVPARERFIGAPGRRRAPVGGGRPTPRRDARDGSGRASRRRPVPPVARRSRPR